MYFWYQSVASAARWLNVASLYVCGCTGTMVGATKNARPENAGLENDGQNFSKLWAQLWGLEMQDWKMTDKILANSGQNYGVWKMQDWKMTDHVN